MKLFAIVDKKTCEITTETKELDRITLYAHRKVAEKKRCECGMVHTHDIVELNIIGKGVKIPDEKQK